jgi:1,4-dihydroxy-2-naphthoyl-CoA hydrolase
MSIWKRTYTLEEVNRFGHNTMSGHLGIVFIEINDDNLVATMPVNEKTVQPFRILHGGANVALAETMGSVASTLSLEDPDTMAVGVEINANHLKSAREGTHVTGICKPIRIGRQIQVWQIEIRDETGDLSCISRLTVSIIPKKK